jgi:hypothetical protein
VIAVSGQGGAKSHGPFGRNHGRTTAAGTGVTGVAEPDHSPKMRTTIEMAALRALVLDDIRWHNCFRFLDIDAPKLFSSRE